jgi:hypothetical protein
LGWAAAVQIQIWQEAGVDKWREFVRALAQQIK